MANDDIQIVRKTVSKGREFYSEGTYGVADSLKACSDAGYQALFMPELAMARADADKDSILWQKWFLAPSARVTGRSKKGNSVVVYAHVPTSISDPSNIRKMIDEKALVNGAGPMKEDEFYSLLEQDGNGRVFVVDYNTLKSSSSSVIKVDEALEHPQTIPFLGGKTIAEAYLAKHRDVYGNRIGIWHSDDLKDRPMGRVLYVDYGCGDGLSGDYDLDYVGRFVGVAPEAQVGREKLAGLEGTVEVLSKGRFLRRDGIVYMPVPEGLTPKLE